MFIYINTLFMLFIEANHENIHSIAALNKIN